MAKKYLVKVYNKSGSYLNTWSEVISNVSFQNEINTAGGQMTITLARKAGDYGEGSDIDFGFKVVVYVFDKELPNGDILFQGFISGYTPIYKNDTVQVTVLSYGETLDNIFIEDTPAIDINLISGSTERTMTYTYNGSDIRWGLHGQSFKPTNNTKLSGVICKMANGGNVSATCYAIVWELDSSNNPVGGVWAQSTDINSLTSICPIDTSLSLGISLPVTVTPSMTYNEYEFDFPVDIDMLSSKTYFVLFTELKRDVVLNVRLGILSTSSSVYANGSLFTTSKTTSVTFPTINSLGADLYFRTKIKTGATSVPFTTQDPSTIVTTILDATVTKGGLITHNNTVDNTNTTVSYTFNVNTVLEGIKKCAELAPKDWYWYIDYATNYLHFKRKENTTQHVFTLEKDLIDAKFEKRIEDVVNVILFTGGDIAGSNFYKRYSNQTSANKYGYRALRYTDQRVTLTSTADAIANSILEARSEPELRVTLEVLDSNNEQGLGYDIESIKVGDTIAVRNVTQQVGLSTWDVARWDEAYWDYSVYNLSSLSMQIQRIEYNQDKAILYASTLAVDVNKRIEDINRNLEQNLVINNPTTPS